MAYILAYLQPLTPVIRMIYLVLACKRYRFQYFVSADKTHKPDMVYILAYLQPLTPVIRVIYLVLACKRYRFQYFVSADKTNQIWLISLLIYTPHSNFY